MKQRETNFVASDAISICELGIKNQRLISQFLHLGLRQPATELKELDDFLSDQLLSYKMLGDSTHYVWHTQEDEKVRSSHAENNGKIFAWDKPPPTGNPGEAFNCHCWAEPTDGGQYANQVLISPVLDNPISWANEDFVAHYFRGNGSPVTLPQTGYLGEVIGHYSESLGVYDRVNQQIIDEAKTTGEGSFIYAFANVYNFQPVLFTFGHSSVGGVFVGEARKEKEYLVISGFITYNFLDAFSDPASFVEALMSILGIGRDEAEGMVGGSGDVVGTPYVITGTWITKFNATVK